MRKIYVCSILAIAVYSSFAVETDTIPLNHNNVGITLAATGLGLSIVSSPAPVIALIGQLKNSDGMVIYGNYIGPGLNITGGILSMISMNQLNNKVNPHGNLNEVGNKWITVKKLASIGITASVLNMAGQIVFYNLDMANGFTFTLAMPVGFVGEIVNLFAEGKSLRQNIKHRNGLIKSNEDENRNQWN